MTKSSYMTFDSKEDPYAGVSFVGNDSSVLDMVGKMAELMLRGYGPETAYKRGVHNKKRLNYKMACDLAVPFLDSNEWKIRVHGTQLVNLAKAYANLGKPEKARVIGKGLVESGDYKNADKVFRYGKIKPGDVLSELDDVKRESYMNHLVSEMKTRRGRSLQKRQQRASEELLVPVALQIEQLDKRLKKVKEERGNELSQYEKMKEEYSSLLGKGFTPENAREFHENAKKAGKLWNKIFKKYGSNEDPRNPKKSKLTELAEKMVNTSERVEAKNGEYSENEKKYHDAVAAMEKRYRQKLQKDAEKLGYKGVLFPETSEPESKQPKDAPEESVPPVPEVEDEYEKGSENTKEVSKKSAINYLKEGKFDEARDVYGKLHLNKRVKKMDQYLEKADGDKPEASRMYLRSRNRWKYWLGGGVLAAALLAGGICKSVNKNKAPEYDLKTIEFTDTVKDLREVDQFINIEKGGTAWKSVKEQLLPKGASDRRIAGRVNLIAQLNDLYEGTDVFAVENGKKVLKKDGIYMDYPIQPGKYRAGKKLERVEIKETRTIKVPVPRK